MAKKKEVVPPKEPDEAVRFWMGEISAARKREKDYRKDGKDVVEIYSGQRKDSVPFNILFSNVETLLPALYSQTPRPVVGRRFKDEDPLGKAAAMAGQRMLEFLADTNVEGYETFDQSMTSATLDGLLPGRGMTAIKYEADIQGTDEMPVIQWEQVCTDSLAWDRVYIGYAKKWSNVPWIAYEQYLDRKECERLFGEEAAAKIVYTTGEDDEDDDGERKGTGTGGREDADAVGARKTALIYQIWDRDGGKKIRYISPAYNDGYLKEEDDPLGITGFFNCPCPLQFIQKSNDMLPTAMYKLYENQAEELNKLTTRLGKVVSALKVRGAYDGALGKELEQIFSGDDNAMVPLETTSVVAAEKGFNNLIWTIPLDKLIVVAQGLITAREQCKRVIYEITGISDILRGQSVASETLGAQKIKESWGTMRLKRLQKEVQRYSRDILRIMLEVAANKMSEDTWAKATGLPFVTSSQRQKLEQLSAAAQAMGAQMQARGQQPTPEQMQQLQQLQAEMAKPQWSQILQVLKDDAQRAYKIDIETNSTIDVEATEDQKNIGDFMNAMGQLMAGLTPMVESGAMPFEASQSLLLAVVRRFRFGTEVEDHFKNMKAPQKSNPEADKAKAEMAKAQQEMQVRQAEMQQEGQQFQAEMQMEMQKSQAEMQMEVKQAQMEAQMSLQIEQAKLQAQQQSDQMKLQMQAEVDAAKLASQRSIEQMKANIQKDTQLQMARIQANTQIQIAKITAQMKPEPLDFEEPEKEVEPAGPTEMEKILASMVESQTKLLEQMSKPRVATLSNGKQVKIETQ